MTQRVVHIDSLDAPDLQPYRTLRRQHDHIQHGIFVAEGEKVVRRLLLANLDVVSLLVTEEWNSILTQSGELARHPGAQVYRADKKLLESIVGYRLHQGIMAVGKVPEEKPLLQTLAALPSPHMLVALDGLANAENVGVVVRNAAGFGVHAIIVGANSSSPYLRRSVRNSMGTVFRLPILHVRDLAASLDEVRRVHHTRLILTDPHAAVGIADADLSGNICIVLGSEETGVSDAVRELATERIAIPMLNRTDSLNVASASAVFMYEVSKTRAR